MNMWLLCRENAPLAVFDDPFKAIEFCYDPDEPMIYRRSLNGFRLIQGTRVYSLTIIPANPSPVILSGGDNDLRTRFIETIRANDLTRQAYHRYGVQS